MESIKRLDPAQLYQRTDPEQFDFETTAELEELTDIIGQSRAVDAMRFGVGIEREGYNIFALGPSGTGKESVIRQHFEKRAREKPTPPDWCYVNNFEDSHKPRGIHLPAGKGVVFRKDMEKLVEEIRTALSAAFESEEYQARRQAIMEEFKEKQAAAFEELQEAAQERGVTLLRTPSGLVIAPVRDGEVLSSEEVQELSEEEQARLQSKVEDLQGELQKIIRQVPAWQRETQEKLNELNQEVASFAIGGLIDELREKYADLPAIREYLDEVQEDVVKNAQDFLAPEEEGPSIAQMLTGDGGQGRRGDAARLRRYGVNVLIDHSDTQGAPVVYEDNPTYQNLIGRVEHMARMGALLTDFQLIKPGALHRASGGYLIVDARKVLTQPYAWEGLKRVLQAGQVRIESVGQMLSMISTVSLEPEPIPLDVKVALFGERMLYYLLWQLDPDFAELFKVEVDFEEQMDRTHGNQQLYAQLIATLAKKKELRPFDRTAVARVIERGARLAGDREKLTMRTRNIVDLLEEADYWAGENGNDTVADSDVQRAIDAQIHRADRVRERVQEAILRDTFLIDTEGEVVGQINGLSVLRMGNFAFGRPTRITARTRLGKGQVLDIEREVELGGPIHSKGVLILSGFLGGRYTSDRPLSLSASLVFEQSYGGVEGDSASTAELYALLSAIADLPIRQSLAVTGSVNQRGRVQAIGGVNEKIEGFFDVCQARGLTGDQGVLIPSSNVKHLMLRQDVVEAVENGQFHIYPVETVDQGIEILTGVPAGERDEEGNYPESSVNYRVARRLAELAKKRQAFSESGEEETE
ncbi:MAG: AAA family ATPase [Anaerolineae bacterium]|jgi:lon-related putative ATP-dependent protease